MLRVLLPFIVLVSYSALAHDHEWAPPWVSIVDVKVLPKGTGHTIEVYSSRSPTPRCPLIMPHDKHPKFRVQSPSVSFHVTRFPRTNVSLATTGHKGALPLMTKGHQLKSDRPLPPGTYFAYAVLACTAFEHPPSGGIKRHHWHMATDTKVTEFRIP